MKHFTQFADLGVKGQTQVLERALQLKVQPQRNLFSNQVLALLFFNPSLRTRVSFETAMLRGDGHAVVLNAGQDNWQLETRPGIRMDGSKPEHLQDAIPVLSTYVDALAVRSFAGLVDRDADERDELLQQIRGLAGVPVISMESAREHPCQGLADMLTVIEHLGGLSGRKLTLTWAPHVKPLPLAVPNSFLLGAAAGGAEITVAHPPGFELHPTVVAEAQGYAAESGARITFSHDQRTACAGAEIVCAKSWAPVELAAAPDLFKQYAGWLVDRALLEAGSTTTRLLHCLPVRRNVEVADSALDSPLSLTVSEAHNRHHAQVAVLDLLLNGGCHAG